MVCICTFWLVHARRCTVVGSAPSPLYQGALNGFVPLCEAIASWHIIRCDGLRHELIQLIQLYRTNLIQVVLRPPPAWEP